MNFGGINLSGLNTNKKRNENKVSSGFIKISPYENKLMLLEKVALIATKKNNINIDLEFSYLDNLIDDTSNFQSKKFKHSSFREIQRKNLMESIIINYKANYWKADLIIEDFKTTVFSNFIISQSYFIGNRFFNKIIENLKQQINFAKRELLNVSFNNSVKFVVAGGFSSGKSTFINSLLKSSLLPTDLKPTSTIPTYIHFSKAYNENQILAQNNNNCFIDLKEDLLKQLNVLTPINLEYF